MSTLPRRFKVLQYHSFHSDALADALERDIESGGPTFSHVSPFVQATQAQNIANDRQGPKLTS